MKKEIYIVANANEVTGGPQSLHQLAFYLSKINRDVYMFYHNDSNTNIPKEFSKYNLKKTETINDCEGNIIIVPETLTYILDCYCNLKKCIWWLSLDFFLLQNPVNRGKFLCKKHKLPIIFSPLFILRDMLNNRPKNTNLRNKELFHLYNCDYVKKYLLENEVPLTKMAYLCGPLSDDFFVDNINLDEKEDIVLYNPKKGMEFTKKLLAYAEKKKTNLRFVPIKNLSQIKVSKLMRKSKVYIDFGFFPGPERIPREAVMMKCNIVTSNIGSAQNSEDIKIPAKYKFDPKDENIPIIFNTINNLVLNYKDYLHDFDEYRNKVILQKEGFKDSVIDVTILLQC